jgi:hypothetical protein
MPVAAAGYCAARAVLCAARRYGTSRAYSWRVLPRAALALDSPLMRCAAATVVCSGLPCAAPSRRAGVRFAIRVRRSPYRRVPGCPTRRPLAPRWRWIRRSCAALPLPSCAPVTRRACPLAPRWRSIRRSCAARPYGRVPGCRGLSPAYPAPPPRAARASDSPFVCCAAATVVSPGCHADGAVCYAVAPKEP